MLAGSVKATFLVFIISLLYDFIMITLARDLSNLLNF